MQIFIDDQPLECSPLSPSATVNDVIQQARTRLVGTGSIIVSLSCDQMLVTPDRIDTVIKQPLSKFARLDMATGSGTQVVIEALEGVRDALEDSYALLKKSAEFFAAGKTSEGMNTLIECLSVWTQVNDAVVQSAELLELDLDTLDFGGRRVVDALKELTNKLDEIRQSLETRDQVLLGDILRYEMDDALDHWKMLLDSFIVHVSEMESPQPAVSER